MVVFGSMTEWIEALLNDQDCMDCKVPMQEGEGTMEFQGTPPHVEFVGRLCEACRAQRDSMQRLRIPKS
jgi:hypothetical protein